MHVSQVEWLSITTLQSLSSSVVPVKEIKGNHGYVHWLLRCNYMMLKTALNTIQATNPFIFQQNLFENYRRRRGHNIESTGRQADRQTDRQTNLCMVK